MKLCHDVGADAVAYDLRTLGIDVRDLFHGGLSPRYVLHLLRWLPDDSATAAGMQGGPQFRGWGTETHLLASVLDSLQAANWQRSGGRGSRPKGVRRPRKVERRVVRLADIKMKG